MLRMPHTTAQDRNLSHSLSSTPVSAMHWCATSHILPITHYITGRHQKEHLVSRHLQAKRIGDCPIPSHCGKDLEGNGLRHRGQQESNYPQHPLAIMMAHHGARTKTCRAQLLLAQDIARLSQTWWDSISVAEVRTIEDRSKAPMAMGAKHIMSTTQTRLPMGPVENSLHTHLDQVEKQSSRRHRSGCPQEPRDEIHISRPSFQIVHTKVQHWKRCPPPPNHQTMWMMT
jgi:hypothetical protein